MVSIIVPVYNTEAYVKRCVESIIMQTHKEFEIILIDDGSGDLSPEICDKLSHNYEKIKVIHKENGGVSTARNSGLDAATGDYILFVDSDDVLLPNHVETLLSALKTSKCDISMCDYVYVKEDQKQPRIQQRLTGNDQIMTGIDAIKKMLYQNGIESGPVGKLYRTTLFNCIRFSNNLSIAEDLEMNCKIFLKSKRVVHSPQKTYVYIQHTNSATTRSFQLSRLDALIAVNNIMSMVKGYPSLERAAVRRLFIEAFGIIAILHKSPKQNPIIFNKCLKIINKYKRDLLRDKNVALRHRLAAALAIISPNLLFAVFGLKDNLSRTARVLIR